MSMSMSIPKEGFFIFLYYIWASKNSQQEFLVGPSLVGVIGGVGLILRGVIQIL